MGIRYLVDTSSFIFRSYYALPHLTNPHGEPVGALYGFANMVLRLINKHQPRHIVFCWDSKVKGERYQVYDQYKANRQEMPADLAVQIPKIREFLDLLGATSVQQAGVEADDLIATLCERYQQQGHEVVIVSGDKDLAALVHDRVRMYDSMKEQWYGPQEVIEKWGVRPEQIADYLAIVGDSSDNVPGVKGLGPKAAQSLLAQYANLEEIYTHLDEISPKWREKLLQDREMAFLSKQLVTLQKDLPVSLQSDLLAWPPQPLQPLLEFLEYNHFQSLVSLVRTWMNTDPSASPQVNEASPQVSFWQPNHIRDTEQLERLIDEACYWIFWNGEIYMASPSDKKIFQLPSEPYGWVAQKLSHKKLCGYDLRAIAHKLQLSDFQVEWDFHLAAYILNSAQDLSWQALLKVAQTRWGAHGTLTYDLLRQWQQAWQTELSEQNKVLQLDFQCSPVLYAMEKKGVLLDVDTLLAESQELGRELKILERKIFELAGSEFNVNSTKQLAFILFEKLQLPIIKKTKTGPSTDAEVLEQLRSAHPLVPLLLDYRELTKLKSTYVDPLPQWVDHNHRLHTHFLQTSTATGRLSSEKPNLQNIPIRTERGARLRKAFIAPPGHLLGSFDYSQIELRILAHLSEDQALIAAFEKGLDVHAATASEIFDCPVKDVTSEQRRIAKAVNFGIVYGQGVFGLAQTLGITRTESKDIIDRHHRRFPRVRDYLQEVIKQAEKQGFVTTLWGRRRYIPEIQSRNPAQKKFGERAAMNAPMQGTAADIVKKAMIDVHHLDGISLVLQIHDELLIEAPQEGLQSQAEVIKRTMEQAASLRVPLVVDFKLDKHWAH